MAESGNLPPITPFPELPDPALYENLSEHERMLQGFPYRPHHPIFYETRKKSRVLARKYMGIPARDDGALREVLDEWLHPSCRDKKNIIIKPPFRCSLGTSIILGENFHAEPGLVIVDKAIVQVGNNCRCENRVHIYSASHPLDGGYRIVGDKQNYFETTAPVTIGDNCWLGAKSIIVPGVTLGNNVRVEMGSVVTKSYPDNVILAGNPARIVGQMPNAADDTTQV